jgi:hypothetical protein
MLPMSAFSALPFVSTQSRSFITTGVPHIDADGNRINTLKLNLDAMFYRGRPGFENNNTAGVVLSGREVLGMTVVIDGPGVWALNATTVLDWGSDGDALAARNALAANHNDQPADLLDIRHVITTAGALEALDMRYSVAPVNNKTIRLTFQGNAGAFSSANIGHAVGQYIFLDPSLHIANATGDTVIRIVQGEEIRLTNLVPPAGGLTVTARGTHIASTFMYIENIDITENVRGALTNQIRGLAQVPEIAYITFRAPDNFRWVEGWSDTAISPAGNAVISGRPQWRYGNDRYITVALPLSTNVLFDLRPITVSLRGLALVADNRADYGDVVAHYNIQFATAAQVNAVGVTAESHVFGDFDIPAGGNPRSADNIVSANRWDTHRFHLGHFQNPINLPRYESFWNKPANNNSDLSWTALPIGTRAYNEMAYGLRTGETAPDRRSGEFNQRTAWLRLSEVASNAWGGAGGLDVTFSVPDHGGAIIQGVQIHFSWQGDPQAWRTPAGFGTWDAPGVGNLNTQQVGGVNFRDADGVLVTPNSVSIQGTRGFNENRFTTRHIDIRFDLAIEAGYEDKHGDELGITVSGTSLANLPLDQRVAFPITIHDPILVDVEPTMVAITSNTGYHVAVQDVDDIFVEETDFGMLKKGEDIWLYVIGARASEVELSVSPIAITNYEESGLKLTRGTRLESYWGSGNINGFRFVVEEQSQDRTNVDRVPGIITFTDVKITGPVYPGVNYQIVVSGNAVAKTDRWVFERNIQRPDQSWVNANNWRLFYDAPYARDAFEFDVEASAPPEQEPIIVLVPAETPADTTPAAPVAVIASQSLTLNEWSRNMYGVEKPFMMVQVSPTLSAGMLSARVFGEFFGKDVVWDSPNGIVKGTASDGSEVEVVLVAGSTTASINGADHDIASYSESAPAGLVSVYVENGSFYVPLRFMTKAFGYQLEWNAATSSVTIRN